MTLITPRLVLECRDCDYRPPEDSVLEAFLLHRQVEHDTDDLAMNMIALCDCGATMRPLGQVISAGRLWDTFHCDACGNDGRVRKTSTS